MNNFVAQPDPNNLFVWHFMIFGLTDCVYENGYYVGTLTFPNNYPMAPPAIKFHTPNGRFMLNYRLCLSISDYHPETWSSAWGIESIILGIISFMNTEE